MRGGKEDTKDAGDETTISNEDLDPKKLASVPYEIISTTNKGAPSVS
jgi:hypothetical protein